MIDKVRKYLQKANLHERILEFELSTATVEQAAQAVGCEPGMIAKTLAFWQDDKPILIVVAGDARICNRKYKSTFNGEKPKMISPGEVEEKIGFQVGGICPFAVNDGVTIYLDNSLKRFSTVYPAGGSSNSAVKLSPEELMVVSKALEWIDVCKIKA